MYFTSSWKGIFIDPESGVAFYKWGIGSRPSYDNIYAFTEVDNECSKTTGDQVLDMHEGHSYFITVMVIYYLSVYRTSIADQRSSVGTA